MDGLLLNGATRSMFDRTGGSATMNDGKKSLVVIGNGMVGQRLLALLVTDGAMRSYRVTTFCEEPRPAYDRVALSSYFDRMSAADLSLVEAGFFEKSGIAVHIGDRVASLDRSARTVTSGKGVTVPYDRLVVATGSYPFVPPLEGRDAQGCFVYRTIDDLVRIESWAKNAKVGAVIGGGLLGLEAAHALFRLGLETHVVELAPHLMPAQIDALGGVALRRRVESLGVRVHVAADTRAVLTRDGAVRALQMGDGTELALDMVVFSAGIRPRDELARAAGLAIGPRGGIVVDASCRSSDADIFAIGECALARGQIWGLVAPGYAMAKVVCDVLLGREAKFEGIDVSTKLKLLGIDVASFGDAQGRSPGKKEIVYSDPVSNIYKKLVISEDGKHVLGGILVGDATGYGPLVQMMLNHMPMPPRPEELILPRMHGAAPSAGIDSLPDEAMICSCNAVSKGTIRQLVVERNLTEVGAVKACTKAGTSCGGCATLVADILHAELRRAGKKVETRLCEHFGHSRQELFDLVRTTAIGSFGELLQRHGTGRGCEICKPAIASILASVSSTYVLDGERASLQDTNDHFLANLQKDGTYSVVPRVPGGEITPEKLILLGTVARDFGLYTKITGGQRIDMFGARVDQLPEVWRRLVDGGFESGHAYAKALRTVKSCVGNTWCRYGVQDSVGLAIEIELRYRGLRAPHKIKGGVSGCSRECAEAQGKDFGVIASEKGWNLFICGNGGMRPQHAVLFAQDLSKHELLRYIDRFLMFYIRTAGRLERTATWLNKRPGGIDELRRILIEDQLGIAAQLEADMAKHVTSYECEWKATLADPRRLSRFVHFVNSPEPDPNVVFAREREQIRPARTDEKAEPALEEVGVEMEVV
jgi:nitrite reductase (NADH) large subunit